VIALALARLAARLRRCRRCPRLVAWRERVAREKRAAFRDESYWGRPVPGFGDPRARLLIVGLAPAAHGGNRTGRMFTGDGSSAFLVSALHRAGFANQATSTSRDDGLELRDARMLAVVRCVPPDNQPTPRELLNCRPWLLDEIALLPRVKAVLTLGRIALDGWTAALRSAGHAIPRLRFAHGAVHALPPPLPRVFVSYHPSRQNTGTGRLTAAMLDRVLSDVRRFLGNRRYTPKTTPCGAAG
jgi:uracil-DNA glycosylase family 4